ncbi:MAG: putative CheA signal transduction histidine kinase [Betaproteobacteria bacterium]|nr:putative CheA signal transduction histidine kinase [Betaproteobacteria bacterium]
MDEMLQDFLTEASELLSDVDNKLVELEKRPGDAKLLNDIFRGFHTIKGGAGFLNLTSMVDLCHLTENLFDKLRRNELALNASIMDAILEATGVVRLMFDELQRGGQPPAASAALLARLRAVTSGEAASEPAPAPAAKPAPSDAVAAAPANEAPPPSGEPDWNAFYNAVTQLPPQAPARGDVRPYGRRASDDPTAEDPQTGRRTTDRVAVAQRETTIRIDTSRLDQVLTLSGELGLAKNRLTCLRQDIVSGRSDPEVMRDIDEAVNQLDLVVGDLQRAVMKTRMQPIGRLFQKYPRMARDLARSLGKEVELILEGEDTELDRAMIDDLADPLIHLVRNAVDHGVEPAADRAASGKPARSTVRLTACQEGDHVAIEIRDDGRGMNPEVLRRKAVEKGLIDADAANRLDANQSLHLVFLPGFSTKDQVSSISGRGVGMDVVKTGIEKLNGRIEIQSEMGVGTLFRISLPLTLAILPVLVVKHGAQPFAVPLGMVHEIITLDPKSIQRVGGRATIVVRDQVLAVRSLSALLGWASEGTPQYGVLMQCASSAFVLAVDDYVGREDVVIKPLTDIKPEGVAGATLSGDGSVILVLDIEPLLKNAGEEAPEAFAAA